MSAQGVAWQKSRQADSGHYDDRGGYRCTQGLRAGDRLLTLLSLLRKPRGTFPRIRAMAALSE